MISSVLADVEKQFDDLLCGDQLIVDAVLEHGDSGDLKTAFTSTEHDPSVGIFGGWVFTLWWRYDWVEEEGRMEVKLVRQDWGGVGRGGRKRWGVPEDWKEIFDLILENKNIIEQAFMRLEMGG
jgi:hypothetical protein